MRLAVLAAVALLGGFSAPAAAQNAPGPTPIPVEAWSLEKVSAMGAAIYRQDVAAWVSTDALIAHLNGGQPPAGMAGWIVVDHGDSQTVRYVRNDGGTMKSAYDIVVRDGQAGAVQAVDEPLSNTEKAQFLARATAIQNIGLLRCSQQLNTVVLDDPDSDGWLVWLLTSTTDSNIIPIGGHYRFRISADGSTVLRRDMLSNGCMNMPRQSASQGEPEAIGVTQLVSDTPVETHVFLSLQNRLPIYVMTRDQAYEVSGAEIRKVDAQ